jgi:hypothetical protein
MKLCSYRVLSTLLLAGFLPANALAADVELAWRAGLTVRVNFFL